MRGYLLSIGELLSELEGSPEGKRLSERDAASGEEMHRAAGNPPGEHSGEGTALERGPAQGVGGRLFQRAFARVDGHRQEKAAAMRPGRGQAASLGAGLLLQLAVAEAIGIAERISAGETGKECWQRYGVSGLLAHLEPMPSILIRYAYGDKGKPYLREYPFFFSISHSGDYVLCVLSRQEIGADIQQHRRCDIGRLAGRFFSEREKAALERLSLKGEAQEAFFRLWARKEAYGKLTGGGIGDGVGVNLLPGEEELPEGRRLIWEQVPAVEGYSIAACRYGNYVR